MHPAQSGQKALLFLFVILKVRKRWAGRVKKYIVLLESTMHASKAHFTCVVINLILVPTVFNIRTFCLQVKFFTRLVMFSVT